MRKLTVASLLSVLIGGTLLWPKAAIAQSFTEYTTQVLNALDTICSVVELGKAISAGMGRATSALGSLPGGAPAKPNALGKAGESAIRDRLTHAGMRPEEQIRYSNVPSQRERRGDFAVSDPKTGTVFIETKNKARLTNRDMTQILDYPTAPNTNTHTIIAVRRGVKVSRAVAQRLAQLANNQLVTIVQCVF